MVAPAPGADPAAHAETMRRMKGSGDYVADHFDEVPLLLFVFAIDDLGGANIYPAIWSALLAARAEGVGGVMTMVLRNFKDRVNDLLGVPVEEGWTMSAMLALGYPRGEWGVAANRRPVHEVSSRNRWGAPFGVEVPAAAVAPSRRHDDPPGRGGLNRRPPVGPACPLAASSPVASRGSLRKSPASPSSAAQRHRRHKTGCPARRTRARRHRFRSCARRRPRSRPSRAARRGRR